LGTISGVTIYDDFAHHPTSISKTLNTIKNKKSFERIIAVVEIRSNTMLMGLHDESLLKSLKNIDQVYFFQSSKKPISLESNQEFNHNKMSVLSDSQKLVEDIIREIKSGDVLIFMSNGDFQGARELLLEKLKILIN
jgi:UDP-N-acetylmuramate: L-alanyl-gamma-D-glutamyl-meso-diaminopimelate ligase